MKLSRLTDNLILPMILIVIIFLYYGVVQAESEVPRWQSPFEGQLTEKAVGDSLSFNHVIGLIAAENPVLKSLESQLLAANGRLHQAGLWSNPEFEIEIEEVGLDAPGFKDAEMTFMLSQEMELFGQKGARKKAARVGIENINWENRKSAFELYSEAKGRFYQLFHAQEQLNLAREALDITDIVYNDLRKRSAEGAVLEAELLLSKLEYQKSQLNLTEAEREVKNASLALSSLWRENNDGLILICSGLAEHECMKDVANFAIIADSSRGIIDLIMIRRLLDAEKELAAAESKPAITFGGGLKRAQSDKSNSLVFGVSLPLPFFNRNQGEISALKAEMKAVNYEIEGRLLQVTSEIDSHIGNIIMLDENLELIVTLLLPTAEETYKSLHKAYQAGRISFTSLLEGKRALLDLRSEKNDVFLSIKEEQLQLEQLIGMPLDHKGTQGIEK